uniref:Putative secreted protein n=1 Tax=Anopheles darlingi TaxID=43151 RepID=A0A2M4D6B9_ANODA
MHLASVWPATATAPSATTATVTATTRCTFLSLLDARVRSSFIHKSLRDARLHYSNTTSRCTRFSLRLGFTPTDENGCCYDSRGLLCASPAPRLWRG